MKKIAHLPSLPASCLIIFAVFISLNCKRPQNVKPLNEKLFVQIYCDVVVYADLVEFQRRDAFVDSVLSNYGVSREQLLKTVIYYSKDEKRWEKVFAKIIAELEQREQALKASIDSSKAKTREGQSQIKIQ